MVPSSILDLCGEYKSHGESSLSQLLEEPYHPHIMWAPQYTHTHTRAQHAHTHLEEEMATRSGILAWRIPWTEEPSGLQSMGLQRARRD